jgi:hypothetical protein
MVTANEILKAEEKINQIGVELSNIAAKIYKIRTGSDIDSRRYGFDSYDLKIFGDPGYYPECNVNYPPNKEVVVVRFYWSNQGGGDTIYVIFPQSYLGDPTCYEKEERIKKELLQIKELEEKAKDDAAAKFKEEKEKAEYERLKDKFGN